MKIFITPVRSDLRLSAEVKGDSLILNGEVVDFSSLGEGERLPQSAIDSHWVASDVTRVNGEITLTLVCPHGHSAPDETRFPTALNEPMSIINGAVELPPYESAQEDVQ